MNQRIRGAFDDDEPTLLYRLIPALSVMAGSLTTIVPVIAGIGLLPPFGLLMLLAWRLSQAEAIAIWAAPLLGLFDDLVSGQPTGCSMLLWSLCFIAFDLVDQRLVWRDFWQDWALAAGALAFCLILGRLVASPLGAHVDTVLLAQILVSSLLYPVIVRLVAWIERTRDPA
ncbi:rod shape-determining protein MreD [Sphingomonas sp. GlSt437]|uniref:rod shape-determining protein MreD n=1 Tax=Sphingomonas sp. GlSt437 TaxID=3389970 RepID=UPI003A8933EE